MAKYRFSWDNLPTSLLQPLAIELGITGDTSSGLRSAFGARPKPDFVKDSWEVLRERWLSRDREARNAVVEALRERRLGDLSIDGRSAAAQLDYLRSCRNSTSLRTVVLDAFIATGEAAPSSAPPAAPAAVRSKDWAPFASTLAQTLAALAPDQFLILERADTPWFVQFAAQGVHGLRAEVVSNAYLDGDDRLPANAVRLISELGWLPPTGNPEESTPDADPDGSPNHFREWKQPVPFGKVADLAVTTAVEALGVPHPGHLRYNAFTVDGTPILLPALGQRSPHADAAGASPAAPPALDRDSVAAEILKVMREVNDNPDIEPDDDGDIGVRFGSSATFIRVFGDPPVVRVYSPVLTGLPLTPALCERLNGLNTGMSFVKWLHTDDTVVATIDLFGMPLTTSHVLAGCQVLGSSIDEVDEELQAQFGGKTFFGEATRPKPQATSGGYL